MMTCKKDVEPYVFNAEIKVSDIRAKQVLVEAINDEEGFEKLSAIVYYSIDEKLDELKQYEMTYEDDRFKAYLTELQDGTRYYYKVVFHGKYNSVETEIDTFETEKIVLPAVTTMQVSDVTTTSAKCGGEVTSEGNGTVTARGICWSISQNPTIEDNKTNDGSGTGSFASQIPDLVPNTQYYVRAYATNEAGTAYGEIVVFYTSKEEQPEIVLPTVTTSDVTDITTNSATCGGNVISDGNGTVTARGVCWSVSPNPTIEDNKTNDGLVHIGGVASSRVCRGAHKPVGGSGASAGRGSGAPSCLSQVWKDNGPTEPRAPGAGAGPWVPAPCDHAQFSSPGLDQVGWGRE